MKRNEMKQYVLSINILENIIANIISKILDFNF